MRIEGEPTQIELTNTYLATSTPTLCEGKSSGSSASPPGLMLVLVGAAGSTSFVVATVRLRVQLLLAHNDNAHPCARLGPSFALRAGSIGSSHHARIAGL